MAVSTVGGVGLRFGPLQADPAPDITKEDREKRAKWVAQEKKHLMRTGMSDKKAQARAAEMFDDDNPWYKEGSTFGKR